MSAVLDAYHELCRLTATGRPLAGDHLQAPPLRTVYDAATGVGYEFKRRVEATDDNGLAVHIDTVFSSLVKPDGNLLLVDWAHWTGPSGECQTCVVHDISLDVATEVAQRAEAEASPHGVVASMGLSLLVSIRGQAHATSWHMYPYEDERQAEARSELEATQGIVQEPWDAPSTRADLSYHHYCVILDALRTDYAHLRLLRDGEPGLIEIDDFAMLWSWMAEQPELTGRL